MDGSDIFEKYDLVDVDESFPIPKIPSEGLIYIYGSSGSGKTTILEKTFKKLDVVFDDNPLYKNFSSPERAEQLLIACGLRSIPAWKRPFDQLSNGEKHRAYCARLLDIKAEYIDEFSSVVDRPTAKALSFALQKYFRTSNEMKRLVIASCHSDILEWLNPDHVYNTDTKEWENQQLPRGCLWRPKIKITIKPVENQVWELFKRHHYLTGKLNKSAISFGAFIEDKLVGFSSFLRFPNGNFDNGWREHRTVVLPEYQGLGIGSTLSDTVADLVICQGGRFFSKTSHPAFGAHREASLKWKATSKNKKQRLDYSRGAITKESKYKMLHRTRTCFSHEYVGE